MIFRLVAASIFRLRYPPIKNILFPTHSGGLLYLNSCVPFKLRETDLHSFCIKMSNKGTKQDDAILFDTIFQELLQILTQKGDGETKDAIQWFKKVLEYNVPGGKKNRGLSVIASFRHLAKPGQLTEDNIRKAAVLGWCVELLEAFFLTADDIMDHSETRRGQTCWYKKDGIGLIAINDALFIENGIYILLRRYFRDTNYYADILDLFHDVTVRTITGQCLDMITAPSQVVNLDTFTEERYTTIVKYKTAFYSFYLPVALAMHMAEIKTSESYSAAKKILLQLGCYFQVQDDYLDCYGDPNSTGKIGTDIEDNKCSWLVVQALKRVTKDERTILEENYGKFDTACVAKVKKLYNQLKLSDIYHTYEETSYQGLMASINSSAGDLPKEIFFDFAERIYKRQK